MTDQSTQHQYHIGDAVTVNFNGAMVPGVIQDQDQNRFQVRLAEPWADEQGNTSDTVWVEPNRMNPQIGEETGGTQALPS